MTLLIKSVFENFRNVDIEVTCCNLSKKVLNQQSQGVSMDTFIRIMMALGIQQSLEALLPDPTVRPIERVGIGAGERKRARPTQYSNERPTWSWGNGEDDDE